MRANEGMEWNLELSTLSLSLILSLLFRNWIFEFFSHYLTHSLLPSTSSSIFLPHSRTIIVTFNHKFLLSFSLVKTPERGEEKERRKSSHHLSASRRDREQEVSFLIIPPPNFPQLEIQLLEVVSAGHELLIYPSLSLSLITLFLELLFSLIFGGTLWGRGREDAKLLYNNSTRAQYFSTSRSTFWSAHVRRLFLSVFPLSTSRFLSLLLLISLPLPVSLSLSCYSFLSLLFHSFIPLTYSPFCFPNSFLSVYPEVKQMENTSTVN